MTDVKKVSEPRKKHKTRKRVYEYIQWGKEALLIMTVLHLILVIGLTQLQKALERRSAADDYREKLM